ncbi:suppressor of cytokine signaling 2 isoform X3 [Kogia breviceps]|uniref:suppressor of cytokine signaling 2 isoform X3 n=1 Tax=Kogia breviceps TaxID=27615 RepID=UPI0034D296E0
MSLLARRHWHCAGRGQCAQGPRAHSLRIPVAYSWGAGGARAGARGSRREPSSCPGSGVSEPGRGVKSPANRGDGPRGSRLPSVQRTPTAPAAEPRARHIPRHLVPKLKVNRGNSGRHPSSRAPPGSPAPCLLGRLPGAEAAAAAEAEANCA